VKDFTTPTVTQALGELQKLGIVRETTGRARDDLRLCALSRCVERGDRGDNAITGV